MPEAEPITVTIRAEMDDMVSGVHEARDSIDDLSASTDNLAKSMRNTMSDSRMMFRGFLEMRVAMMSVENTTKALGINNQFLTDSYKAMNIVMDIAISIMAIQRAAHFALALARWVSAKAGFAEAAAEESIATAGFGMPVATAEAVGSMAILTAMTIPFAQGGIVTGPTRALIGEAGPEAVIPLSRGGTNLGGITVHMNIYSNDPDMISRELGRRIQQLQNAGGF